MLEQTYYLQLRVYYKLKTFYDGLVTTPVTETECPAQGHN